MLSLMSDIFFMTPAMWSDTLSVAPTGQFRGVLLILSNTRFAPDGARTYAQSETIEFCCYRDNISLLLTEQGHMLRQKQSSSVAAGTIYRSRISELIILSQKQGRMLSQKQLSSVAAGTIYRNRISELIILRQEQGRMLSQKQSSSVATGTIYPCSVRSKTCVARSAAHPLHHGPVGAEQKVHPGKDFVYNKRSHDTRKFPLL
jgi:hypothetical protein